MGKQGKALIIVESPAKMKTLKKFLGERDYIFASSVGHIRDLPAREFGIDLENDFEPKYEILPDKKDVARGLIRDAKKVDKVYLSPDPDREGEAIAWHIAEILPKNIPVQRATFHSITKEAVQEALNNPREIDYSMVDAQQARRLLDRMVGYKISPILNRRIKRGRDGALSAGRVQSVALKLVVDRELEIEAFNPVEYWKIAALMHRIPEGPEFEASLYSVDNKKVEKEPIEGKDVYLIGNEETAKQILQRLENAEFTATRVDKKEKRRNPVPPFITSTLQQEASRHYGFSTTRTMSIAQTLYEGVDMGDQGTEGLITYMRTDSTRVAPEALSGVREFIQKEYGPNYLPPKPRQFSSKKSAQDAHEAIRPTNFNHPPEKVKPYLTKDQYQIYTLIWRRMTASQMLPAVYDTVSADLTTDDGVVFRATGSVIKFQGFLAVYEEKTDEEKVDKDGDRRLPHLEEGQKFQAKSYSSDQAFTRPPPRYSEALLVKELEKSGIGRPSTYAAIMNKIQSRDYTTKEANRLKPTELGRIITQMLETNFQDFINVNFTAHMENDLELVAADEKNWKELIRDFWNQFTPVLEKAEKEAFVPKVPTDIDCPDCGAKLQKVWARSKYFYGCSNYPDCSFSSPIEQLNFDKSDYAENFNWDQKCPQCEADMVLRHGRYGAFLGCSKYPDCRGIVNIPKKGEEYIPPEDMPDCPAEGCPGKLVARKSRFGKTFFSCSTYPECDVIGNAIEDVVEKYTGRPRTASVKKTKAKGKAKTTKAKKGAKSKSTAKPRKPRKMPDLVLSPVLADLCGVPELPRTQVVKKIWDHIKEKGLQDPKDKRMILPDETLAKVFGTTEPVQMFQITKLIGPHLSKKED